MIALSLLFGLSLFQAHAQEVKMSDIQTANASESIVFAMGCFWGAEKRMSAIKGVLDVESGYAGGDQAKTSYEQVLNLERQIQMGISQTRNHAEVIKVTFDPQQVSLETLMIQFWENHDPTQGDRQGNDIGSNYRSAIYTQSPQQVQIAEATKQQYQRALDKAGYAKITTEIAPLRHYTPAEEYHQNYLEKNPNGYCGLGGIGVKYPTDEMTRSKEPARKFASDLSIENLNKAQQLIVFEAEDCQYCKAFKKEILSDWQSTVAIATSLTPQPPAGWTLSQPLFATPTIVLFKEGQEVSRFTGYTGDKKRFWQWLGFQLLTPEQQRIAFEQGTEPAFSGSHLDEKRPGTFVDPITGAALFRTDTKFESGSGWPSFFNPVEGAITEHPDRSHGMVRTEVRSASSGIHLGHVFNDGPPPTYKRYCINGNVLKFVAD